VVGGLETIDKMEKIETDDKDRPTVRYHWWVHVHWFIKLWL